MSLAKSSIKLAIGIAIGGSLCNTVSAALPSNTVFQFDPGVTTCALGIGTPPDNCYYGTTVKTGSFFGMDTSGNGVISLNERTAVIMANGLQLGIIQDASGSHSGFPDGSENVGIDLGWNFFGNTGLHKTSVAPTILGGDDGTGDGMATLGFSGWEVTWNGIPTIKLNTGAVAPGFTNGQAKLSCFTDSAKTTPGICDSGEFYTLIYDATVPQGDPSGFGGVHYQLNMFGQITVPADFIEASTQADGTMTPETTPGPGQAAQEAGTQGRLTLDQLNALTNPIPQETGTQIIDGVSRTGIYSVVSSYFNFAITGISGNAADVILPLSPSTIPVDAEFHKWDATQWVNFVPDGVNNVLGSALSTAGTCPTDFASYDITGTGLQEGDDCVFVAVLDNDTQYDLDDTVANVEDPSGVVVFIPDPLAPDLSSSTDGCSVSRTPVKPSERADWWLVGGFLAWMGALVYRRRRSQSE